MSNPPSDPPTTPGAPVKRPAEPSNRLPQQAQTLWRIHHAVAGTVVTVAATIGGYMLGPSMGPAFGLCALLVSAAAVVYLPGLRWRRWRFEVGEHEIDLLRGVVFRTRTVLPLNRVQHVEMNVNPVAQRLGLAQVDIHTAAGSHTIPALTALEAKQVTDRIAELTRSHDDL